ncbi:MAG TPA: flagellar basal body rod protein FlgC [Treponemataceae bacterium]|jgi:flagellar basal-body rod protein FlgC|nr:MAG: flagellar basal body rod protein FlgC [Treponema sp.]HOC28301.1 flagellar basal body rod protein FlgC [Treponemataceae bacterium]HPX48650.1 flagellar basal body rod protein FlgC [Treponemataceae bacterium]HQL31850.1 flagellar basal body rod protein FlgC [Treponemataceae bacterium]
MGLFTSINIAATGMSAERLRTDVISDNIANASTTRTQDGGAFKRSRVVLAQKENGIDWRTAFTPENIERGPGSGVKVVSVEKDSSDMRMVYDPTHPDAIKSGPKTGYVEYPNVNIVTEMVDLISASRSYEANSSVIQGSKEMFMRALEIGR